MAETTVTHPPAFVSQLEAALQKELPGAQVSSEQIRASRYRFEVVWSQFSGVGHPERQQRVWAIAERVVPRPDLLDVGMIMTVAPEELPQG
jgi:hypothetical protein